MKKQKRSRIRSVKDLQQQNAKVSMALLSSTHTKSTTLMPRMTSPILIDTNKPTKPSSRPKTISSMRSQQDFNISFANNQFTFPKTNEIPENSVNKGCLKTAQPQKLYDFTQCKGYKDMIPNRPITPVLARQRYRDYLTEYEMSEIRNFKEIYFLGRKTTKTNLKSSNNLNSLSDNNSGFDSISGNYYKIFVGDHLNYRYEIISILGKGSFGEVVKCFDHKLQQFVAVKIIVNTELMKHQGLTEIETMKMICNNSKNEYSCLCRFVDTFSFRNHLCVVTEILGNTVLKELENKNFEPFNLNQIKSIVYDVVVALLELHKNCNIIHCDLKPENILFLNDLKNPIVFENITCKNNEKNNSKNNNSNSVDNKCKKVENFYHVKLIDFGSSCSSSPDQKKLFNYLQSRFYRAPEVFLGLDYSTPIDFWSLGCIIVELASGKPLFNGQNEADQMKKFVEVLGNPPFSIMQKSPKINQFLGNDGKIYGCPTPFKIKLSSLFKQQDVHMIDFVTKCLEWDQNKRMTAIKAMNHPFISKNKK